MEENATEGEPTDEASCARSRYSSFKQGQRLKVCHHILSMESHHVLPLVASLVTVTLFCVCFCWI